ncbi:MAG: DUF4468 domain-containing protein [Salinivirgaceae bacterium]|jgi:hypothetical protein
MKTLTSLLFVTIIFSIETIAQDTIFKFTKESFTDFVVTPCDGKTQSEIYIKTLDWVSATYKNPKEVLKVQKENDYIRIEGASDNLVCFGAAGTNCCASKYIIEIAFKEGKYKFDVIGNIEYLYSAGWADIKLDNTALYYNNKGVIRNNYMHLPDIADYFNNLNVELKQFIMSEKNPLKDNNW